MAFTGKATYSAGAGLPELVEDVSDIIGIVSPHETPLLDHLGDAKRAAMSTVHEWIEDALLPNYGQIDQASFSPDPQSASTITVDDASVFRVGDLIRPGESGEVAMVAAVVTAALPSSASATSRASRFAPRCPPRSGITTVPSSETDKTGGSVRLSLSNGATARIRMPEAQTPMIGTPAANRSRAWSSALSKTTSALVRPARPWSAKPCASAMRRATASPDALRHRTIGLTAMDRPLF